MATATRPRFSGVFWEWSVDGADTIDASLGDIQATCQTSNWGPINKAVTIRDEAALYAAFGNSDTPLHRAVKGALKGHGVRGRGGARAVVAVRQAVASGGGAAAKATKVLNNTAAAPAVTLTARYEGTRANDLRVTVQPAAGGGNEIVILDGTLVVERYPHAATNIAPAIAAINASSDWFTGTVTTDGTALNAISASAVTGGVDGSTLTGTEWATTFGILDREAWSAFAPHGLTDTTIRAAVVAWIKERNSLGARCWAVVGGGAGETLSTAVSRSQAINDPNVINLGVGSLVDNDDGGRVLSTAEFVTRYAGARCWRGERLGDLYVRFGGIEVDGVGVKLSDQQTALDAGVTVFSRDTFAEAPVHVREGVTTYSNDSASPLDDEGNKTHPVWWYSIVKNVAVQHGVENDVALAIISGDLFGEPVDDKTRQQVLGLVRNAYATRQEARVVQAGWTVDIAGPTSDDDDFVIYKHAAHPTRGLRQIFNVARVG